MARTGVGDLRAPHRPALRYFGGKWRLAPWIISHFPKHVCYDESFCGAASVMMRKEPSRFEYLNDADGRVVNFFTQLRDHRVELERRISLTPFSRAEFELVLSLGARRSRKTVAILTTAGVLPAGGFSHHGRIGPHAQ